MVCLPQQASASRATHERPHTYCKSRYIFLSSGPCNRLCVLYAQDISKQNLRVEACASPGVYTRRQRRYKCGVYTPSPPRGLEPYQASDDGSNKKHEHCKCLPCSGNALFRRTSMADAQATRMPSPCSAFFRRSTMAIIIVISLVCRPSLNGIKWKTITASFESYGAIIKYSYWI